MIFWIVLVFLAVAAILFFKFEHHFRLFRIALLGFIVVLIYLSMSSVLSSGEVNLDSPRGIVNAVYLYVGWLGETTAELFDIGKDSVALAGNAVKVGETEKEVLPNTEKEDFSITKWITEKIRKE
jgi:hypothetical protein